MQNILPWKPEPIQMHGHTHINAHTTHMHAFMHEHTHKQTLIDAHRTCTGSLKNILSHLYFDHWESWASAIKPQPKSFTAKTFYIYNRYSQIQSLRERLSLKSDLRQWKELGLLRQWEERDLRHHLCVEWDYCGHVKLPSWRANIHPLWAEKPLFSHIAHQTWVQTLFEIISNTSAGLDWVCQAQWNQ